MSRGFVLSVAVVVCGVALVQRSKPAADEEFAQERGAMMRRLQSRGIRDPVVLQALSATPRHLFVPDELRRIAYLDRAIAINAATTIPEPYVAARMLELLRPRKTDRVLEIGTGSGYQTALLAGVAGQVYTLDIAADMIRAAKGRLARLGYTNVVFRQADGFGGWRDEAPFDRILLTAAPTEVPPVLVEELAPGGVLVGPVGPRFDQVIVVARKKADGSLSWDFAGPAAMPPMTPDRS